MGLLEAIFSCKVPFRPGRFCISNFFNCKILIQCFSWFVLQWNMDIWLIRFNFIVNSCEIKNNYWRRRWVFIICSYLSRNRGTVPLLLCVWQGRPALGRHTARGDNCCAAETSQQGQTWILSLLTPAVSCVPWTFATCSALQVIWECDLKHSLWSDDWIKKNRIAVIVCALYQTSE